MPRARYALSAIQELGIQKTFLYALYQFGLKSGHFKRVTPIRQQPVEPAAPLPDLASLPIELPAAERLRAVPGADYTDLIREADEITRGQFRPFGGPPQPLNLCPPDTGRHWSKIHDSAGSYEDIKLLWEPARFDWAYTLCRAYRLTGDERYPQAFWAHTETFLKHNPVNAGPNWASGQEVALRLIALLFAGKNFAASPASTPQRQQILAAAAWEHARRIPPTLLYARAQNNNHLITEAAGLYTAGIFFQQPRWRELGWRWLNHAFQQQIAGDGTYIQQSTNYHRLMLQAALWVDGLARSEQQPFPEASAQRLSAATRWLGAQMDLLSGSVPNLGHNDGARIMPLYSGTFGDYRPVLQAAAAAFLGRPVLPPGAWDELLLWMGLSPAQPAPETPTALDSPAVLRIGDSESWGSLRAVRFSDRPAHADQLHVDLWWQGQNIAQDAGTYRYTAPQPWLNALAHSAAHNTLTLNGLDQMQSASRFLWLDWAQARVLPHPIPAKDCVAAEHDGYRRLGVLHRRTLCRETSAIWDITDELLPLSTGPQTKPFDICLHWLLPDWEWDLAGSLLRLQTPDRIIEIEVRPLQAAGNTPVSVQLVRAGVILAGPAADLPTLGWVSPSYNQKTPALALRVRCSAVPPFKILTRWVLQNR